MIRTKASAAYVRPPISMNVLKKMLAKLTIGTTLVHPSVTAIIMTPRVQFLTQNLIIHALRRGFRFVVYTVPVRLVAATIDLASPLSAPRPHRIVRQKAIAESVEKILTIATTTMMSCIRVPSVPRTIGVLVTTPAIPVTKRETSPFAYYPMGSVWLVLTMRTVRMRQSLFVM